jgi:hypothetical protein
MADGCKFLYFSHIIAVAPPHNISILIPIFLLVNDERTQRVADLLADFRNLQHYIAAAPTDCPHPDDYYTEGWAALRQCALDGQHILNVAADTHVPRGRTADEQNKVELQQYVDLTKSFQHWSQDCPYSPCSTIRCT